jgi:Domain of unknown function (DUF6378)
VLAQRGSQYGAFETQAMLAQFLKDNVRQHLGGYNWNDMSCMQREAIDMILHKVSRIVNGDPNYKDSWTDIIGYAKLIEDTL